MGLSCRGLVEEGPREGGYQLLEARRAGVPQAELVLAIALLDLLWEPRYRGITGLVLVSASVAGAVIAQASLLCAFRPGCLLAACRRGL